MQELHGQKGLACSAVHPEGLISSLYGCEFSVGEGEIRGNFYKCADDSPTPHYGALFPVDSVSLGFHNPERFGTIKIIKR